MTQYNFVINTFTFASRWMLLQDIVVKS